jgi:peptide/nickel transport system substrate-binding protein
MTLAASTRALRSRAGLTCCTLFLAAAACGDAQPDAQTDARRSADAETPRTGGTLVVAGPNNLDALNSLVATEVYEEEILKHVLFVPLVGMDSTLAYVPALASSWQLLGDTAIEFRLRDDVRWHDGTRTSAYDVAFTFERLKDPATGYPTPEYFDGWTAAEVVDSSTVRFRLEPPLIEPLAGWASTVVMPMHLLDTVPPAQMMNAAFNRAPVGNGPFRFVSAQENDRWVFEANPDFPEALGGRPHIDRLVWRVVPENATQIAELQTGGAHLILSPRAEQLAQLDALPDFRAVSKPARRYVGIAWNGRRAPLDDARVRRALSLAIDRAEMLQVLRSGYGELAYAPVPPLHWAYASGLNPLPYDTAAARVLLAEAGLRDANGDGTLERADGSPFALELKIPANNQFNRDIAEMVQADLADVGIAVAPRPVEFATLVGQDLAPGARSFDAVVMGMATDVRLDLRSLFHSDEIEGGPFQLAAFRNPAADVLMDSIATAADRADALPLWHRLQEIVREEQPWTYLWHAPDLFVIDEDVHGVRMDLRGVFVNLPDWWLGGS